MKSIGLALTLLALPLSVFAAQDKGKAADTAPAKDTIPVSVTAKGSEVRTVLMSIFDQEKKQYVIEPNIHFAVFLSLENADFHRALDIVCTLAGLQAELRDGIYFVHTGRDAVVRPVSSATTTPPPATPPVSTPAKTTAPAPTSIPVKTTVVAPKPVLTPGPVPSAALLKHVTTRYTKTDIRALFAEFSKQTGVKIVVDANVPAYKLDAFLINTSLRYALIKVTKAAGLAWKLPQNHTIEISAAS